MAKAKVEAAAATQAADDGKADGALVALAAKLDGLAQEAAALGEAVVAKKVERAAKSARHAAKVRATRLKKVGGLVAALKAQGLTAEQIVARLTEGGN